MSQKTSGRQTIAVLKEEGNSSEGLQEDMASSTQEGTFRQVALETLRRSPANGSPYAPHNHLSVVAHRMIGDVLSPHHHYTHDAPCGRKQFQEKISVVASPQVAVAFGIHQKLLVTRGSVGFHPIPERVNPPLSAFACH